MQLLAIFCGPKKKVESTKFPERPQGYSVPPELGACLPLRQVFRNLGLHFPEGIRVREKSVPLTLGVSGIGSRKKNTLGSD